MRRFRVALDGRRMHGNKRGVGLYVSQLARNLPRLARDIDFLLLVDRELPEADIPDGCRQLRLGPAFSSQSQSRSGIAAKARSVWWMNTLVPDALRRADIDLFHATNFAVPLLSRRPCVVTVHDLIFARAPGAFSAGYERYLKLLVPMSVRKARHIIADSEATRSDIVELLGVEPDKVTAVHLAAGSEFDTPPDPGLMAKVRDEHGLPQRFVLHVGAIERRKKLDALIQACAPLLREGVLDGVVLAGEEGYGAEEVRTAARQTGVLDSVHFLGYVPADLLPPLYSMARVLSLVSVYEGFGIPVLEAMACRTPVVASVLSSLPEVGGDAALYVDPGDVEALAGAIKLLLTDEAARDRAIRRGLEQVKRFTWERAARAHVDVYRRVLREAAR